MTVSEEQRAALEEIRNELLRKHDEISMLWLDHELTTMDAILMQREVCDRLLPILKELAR